MIQIMKKLQILLPLLLLFAVVSCEKETEEKIVKISFDTDGGSEVASIYVKQGRSLEKNMEPKPSKPGFEVSKWVAYGAVDVQFNDTFFVSSNTTLKAVWKVATAGGTDPVAAGIGVMSNTCAKCHSNYAIRFKGDKAGAESVIDGIGVSGTHSSRGKALSDTDKMNAKAYIKSL